MGIFDKLGRLLDDALFLPEELRAALARGEAQLGRGEHGLATATFEAVLSARPEHPRILALYARALRGSGRLPDALAQLRRALAIDPADPEALFEMGEAQRDAGDDAAALEALKTAAAVLANQGGLSYARALSALAELHRRVGRPDRAVRELRKAALAAPADAEVQVRLAEALLADGEPAGARAALLAAAERELPGGLAARIGAGLLGLGAAADAEALLRIACLEPDPAPGARRDLARALLLDGDWPGAIEEARLAGNAAPDDPEPWRIQAEAHARAGEPDRALEAWEHALTFDARDPLALRGAVRAATSVPETDRAEALARRLDGLLPGDPVARGALARIALARGDLAAAEALLAAAGDEPELASIRAEIALGRGDGESALAALAVAPDAPVAMVDRAARAVALAGGPLDLSVLLERLHRYALGRADLATLAVEVARVRGELDRPLQLAIMGEFNAGKSTFINALIGEEVAPMGVTPTTATLNVLRYGAERKVRVVHLDDTAREGSYDDLKRILAEAAASARSVRRVEILFPAEVLLRVNLVDTPGTNALDPAHEAIALRAIEDADAVVWLFRAGQVGKESERRALEAIRGHRRKVVAIINHIDRVAPEEVPGLVAHLDRELGGSYFEAVAALSAKEALVGKRTGDRDRLVRSGIDALESLLEQRFYSNALVLKRRSSAIKLEELLSRLLREQSAALGALSAETARLQALGPERTRATGALRRVLGAATERVDRALGGLARQAAAEVDELVRPRAGLLTRRGFAAEDRRFLGELLDERIEALAREEEAVLRAELEALTAPLLVAIGMAESSVANVVELVVARGLTTLSAYQRGAVSGGALARLFDQVLLPTSQRAEIERALQGLLVDPRDVLRPVLESGAGRLETELAAAHGQATEAASRRERAFQRRTVDPLRGFALVAAELARE